LLNPDNDYLSSTSITHNSPADANRPCRSVLLRSVLLTEAANIACRDGINAVALDHVADTVGTTPSVARCVYADDRTLIDALWEEMAHQLEMRLLDHRQASAVEESLSSTEFTTARFMLEYRCEDFREMTIQDVVNDPLILLLSEADGVNSRAFAQLLESASRVLATRR